MLFSERLERGLNANPSTSHSSSCTATSVLSSSKARRKQCRRTPLLSSAASAASCRKHDNPANQGMPWPKSSCLAPPPRHTQSKCHSPADSLSTQAINAKVVAAAAAPLRLEAPIVSKAMLSNEDALSCRPPHMNGHVLPCTGLSERLPEEFLRDTNTALAPRASTSQAAVPWRPIGHRKLREWDEQHRQMTARITGLRTWQALDALLASQPTAAFNYINISAALVHLARLREGLGPAERAALDSSGIISRLTEATLQRLGDYQAQALANTIHSFGRLGFHPGDEVLDALAAAAVAQLRYFKCQEVGNSTWGFAKLGHSPGPSLLDRLAYRMCEQLHYAKPQEISNTLWAYATLGHTPQPEALFRMLSAAAVQLDRFKPQELANLVWALPVLCRDGGKGTGGVSSVAADNLRRRSERSSAALQPGPPRRSPAATGLADVRTSLLQRAAQHLDAELLGYKPAELSVMLCAFARLNTRPEPRILDRVAARLASIGDAGLNAQDVANTLWAYAILAHRPSDAFLSAMAGRLRSRRGEFSPQGLSFTLWAFSTLGFTPGELELAAALEITEASLPAFQPDQLVVTLCALVKLCGGPAPPLRGRLTAALGARVAQLTPHNITNVLWACGKMGLRGADEPLVGQLAREAFAKREGFNAKDLANTFRALARCDFAPPAQIAEALLQEAARKAPQFGPTDLTRLLVGLRHLPQAVPCGALVLDTLAGRALQLHGELSKEQLVQVLAAVDQLAQQSNASGPAIAQLLSQ